jgi:hypothetical protein
MYPEEEEADSTILPEEEGGENEMLVQPLFNGDDSDQDISASVDDAMEEEQDEFGSENLDSLCFVIDCIYNCSKIFKN